MQRNSTYGLIRATQWGLVALLGSLMCLSVAMAQQSESSGTVKKDLNAVRSQIDNKKKQTQQLGEKLDALTEAEGTLKDRLISTAGRAQSLESKLLSIEQRLTELRAREAEKLGALRLRKKELEATVAGLQRLRRRPPQALLLAPGTTHDAIRSTILLRATTPVLLDRADRLKRDITTLAQVRARIGTELANLRTTQDTLETERHILTHLSQVAALRRQQTEQEKRAQQKQIASLAKKAEGLQDLLVRLDTLRRTQPKPAPRLNLQNPDGTSAASAPTRLTLLPPVRRGDLRLPAAGPVLTGFGDRLDNGDQARGLTIKTRANATITAPSSGRVAYADIFRNYGLLLIIEHADGYHTLLSGMEKLDVTVDQHITTGEPVGHMGSERQEAKLYVELRANGEPINPMPWYTALNKKVNG